MSAEGFDLTFRPPPPLSRRGARLVVGVTALVAMLAALRFYAVGAWIVLPFLLVDVALLAWAFSASRRASRAFERIALLPGQLTLERSDAAGRVRAWRLPARETRLELETCPPQDRLWLRSGDKRMLLGRHLNRNERAEVFEKIAAALNR